MSSASLFLAFNAHGLPPLEKLALIYLADASNSEGVGLVRLADVAEFVGFDHEPREVVDLLAGLHIGHWVELQPSPDGEVVPFRLVPFFPEEDGDPRPLVGERA